jgi:curved DNA-binding protein CbpA
MSGDLYEVLGVKRDADADVLRSAFRRKAKKTHPDVGGSAEEFAAIEQAYRVLSDPEARARYDATGEVPERAPDNSEAAALGIIGNMLVSIIGSHNTGDPLAAMRHSLAGNISQAQHTIGDLQGSVARCEKLLARFKTKHERDPIKGMIGSQIANMRLQIENHRQAIVTMERAQTILKDYRFEFEQTPTRQEYDYAQLRPMTRDELARQGWMSP